MPTSGTLHLNSEGRIELKVWSEALGKCAEKSANEAEVNLTETSKEECKLEETPTGKTVREVMEPLLGTEVSNNDPEQNLRYVGPNPNNYVKFNNELWRIIGVFNGQAKIIRNEFYSLNGNTAFEWDYASDGSKTNNWATASLQL